ncbi:aminotransferase class IV [Clostridium luticellarii]|jgi:4-amino-4-deoxychorismate lyase|uniref:Branched-chain-amino-acid aminotransferase n=1 Tax=Clostridium luticellarii TaxID=1691940 RepID=A0A2T0BDR4_9CLOT|nr:aminotransferase class IV [Clostridium luticellarii]MCI1945106.1 aminotransferase class IV [Clostridium luticellarii]MCI1968599.1 aminotransferase class IV [Clostridium luticellarii]MCI1995903.1 aminotransferase class IV [Clostridium luticellarii]MCI2040996.1 aminotransferase class IV [Clostridium luticellarii]PRR81983.1 Branched-chain-amino-acid aminotransferase [Clostridium luticellarii]
MIILNGNLTEDEKVFADSGFYFGRGLFETMLVKGHPLFLEEHLHRINEGLRVLNIHKSITKKEIVDAVKKLNCDNKILKLVVTEKNTVFTCRVNKYGPEQYKNGFSLKMASTKRNPYSKTTYLKSLNYVENILEHEQCINEGYDEVLFLNTENFIAEGSTSNVFFIQNGRIYTPSLNCGILNGTIRKYIIDNYEVTEGKFTEDFIENSQEIFLTNSVMGIMKVSNILGKKFYKFDAVNQITQKYNNDIMRYQL